MHSSVEVPTHCATAVTSKFLLGLRTGVVAERRRRRSPSTRVQWSGTNLPGSCGILGLNGFVRLLFNGDGHGIASSSPISQCIAVRCAYAEARPE